MTDPERPFLRVSSEVADALEAGEPVVALESTIISHGMPHPSNIETALAVEEEVRVSGAIPATIAVIDGAIRVGIDTADIELLATHPDVMKISRRDLPFALSRGIPGGTTVAGTMIAAAMAGIHIFATGGIGGVHRDAAKTFDVSADLQELSRTDVTVVCAGVKSILDIGATLEYLETLGVPVIGYRTDEMPAFYTAHSGHPVPHRCDDPDEIARVLETRAALDLGGGAVVVNPIPSGQAMEPDVIESAITRALDDARTAGISGREVTPFVLGRVGQLTGEASLEANIALVRSNARLAGEIAVALVG